MKRSNVQEYNIKYNDGRIEVIICKKVEIGINMIFFYSKIINPKGNIRFCPPPKKILKKAITIKNIESIERVAK